MRSKTKIAVTCWCTASTRSENDGDIATTPTGRTAWACTVTVNSSGWNGVLGSSPVKLTSANPGCCTPLSCAMLSIFGR